MDSKIKEYFDKKINVDKTHPRQWSLQDRFYYIEFLANTIGVQVKMSGLDKNRNIIKSEDIVYTPSLPNTSLDKFLN